MDIAPVTGTITDGFSRIMSSRSKSNHPTARCMANRVRRRRRKKKIARKSRQRNRK